MAKIYGLFGAMTGKLADTVMAVRNGEQLARKYQPVVYNPSTSAQVAQRAKLKAISQLSAVVAPVIAIPKQGSVSCRNLFTKKNFPLVTYANNIASINLEGVQLTSSAVGFIGVTASRGEGVLNVALDSSYEAYVPDVDRVVYVGIVKLSDDSIRLSGSTVVQKGSSVNFAGTLPDLNVETVVLAYGIRDNNDAARAAFGNLEAATAVSIAQLIVTRNLLEADVTMTETVGVTIAAPSRDVDPERVKTTKKK